MHQTKSFISTSQRCSLVFVKEFTFHVFGNYLMVVWCIAVNHGFTQIDTRKLQEMMKMNYCLSGICFSIAWSV